MSDKLYKETQQILLGSEQLFPNENVIPLVRFFVEKLFYDQFTREELLSDAFKIIKDIDDFMITASIEQFVLSMDPKEKIIALLNLVENLTHNELAPQMKILLKHMSVNSEDVESVEKIIISTLTSLEHSHEVFSLIKSLYLEKDKLISCKKLTKLYNFVYDKPIFDRFRKLAEHFLTLKSDFEVWNYLFDRTGIQLFERLRFVKQNIKSTKISEAFSKGQIKSKLWLAKNLNKVIGGEIQEIHILCGWYGTLADCLSLNLVKAGLTKVTTYDIDEACQEVATILHLVNFEPLFIAKTQDIFKINYDELPKPLCLINTSCEHLSSFSEWFDLVPKGTLVALQNNNFFKIKEHINCVNSLKEFKEMAPLSQTLYEGDLVLEKYTRFMLIGYK